MRKVIAFDLDDTLAVTKSPIPDQMCELLGKLIEKYDLCIISGGNFNQFKRQVIGRLNFPPHAYTRLHLMPTCGTRYYRYNETDAVWELQYAENLAKEERVHIIDVLEGAAREEGLWEEKAYGDIIEDRESQVTYSALGQKAPPEVDHQWSDKNLEGLKRLRDVVAERLPAYGVHIGGGISIDITRKGTDKAYGMEKLMQALEIGKGDILFIGDKLQEGGNDYPVKAMGIDTIEVNGWKETARVIEELLATTA